MQPIDLIDTSSLPFDNDVLKQVYELLQSGSLTEEAIAVTTKIKLTDVQECKKILLEQGLIDKKVRRAGRPVGFSPTKSLKACLQSLNQCLEQEFFEGASLSVSVQEIEGIPQVRIKIVKEEEL